MAVAYSFAIRRRCTCNNHLGIATETRYELKSSAFLYTTVLLEKSKISSTGASACGATTKACPKCFKQSNYMLRIRDGSIVEIR